MTNFPEQIASALMESIMAAFRTEAADLETLAKEVDAAGQDVEKIRAAIERHANRRTQAMETIRTMLTARGGGVQTRAGHWVNRGRRIRSQNKG